MNIFRVLASGDGAITEPNVSAFLAYLLDPKADHNISDELIKRVFERLHRKNPKSPLNQFLIDRYGKIRKLGFYSNFHFEVLLEQAFTEKEKSKREIVDIVILCYERVESQKESLAQIMVKESRRGTLRQIFLIENKIRDSATREGQLTNQVSATINTLKRILKKSKTEIQSLISLVFVSPQGPKSIAQFKQTEKEIPATIPRTHIPWQEKNTGASAEESGHSFVDYLRDILTKESGGECESISEYTKSTIKSFIAFIENGFRSAIEEKLEAKIVRDIGYRFSDFRKQHDNLLNDSSWLVAQNFQQQVKREYSELIVRHSPTHPVSVLVNDNGSEKKIFSLTKSGQQLKIQLVYRRFPIGAKQKKVLQSSIATTVPGRFKEYDDCIEFLNQTLTTEQAFIIFKLQYQWALEEYPHIN